MSSTIDFDVIKEIPGFKIILKAVLKSQIQQLVEQLATYTEEESVILTASLTDGSLSHLGSDSGKSFLEDNEDIKSHFLGFCLKKHHKKKQEEDRESLRRASEQTAPHFTPTRLLQHATPHFSGTPGQRFAMSGMRHQPYPVTKPVRVGFNTTLTSPLKSPSKVDEEIIKIEPGHDDESSNQSVSQPSSPSSLAQMKNESCCAADENIESSSISTIPNEILSQRAANFDAESSTSFKETSSALQDIVSADAAATDFGVKVEAVSESEMDLEITGVEPGRLVLSQGGWTPNVSMAVNFNSPSDAVNLDLLGGATTASQPDVQTSPSGYNAQTRQSTSQFLDDQLQNPGSVYECMICNKIFPWSSHLDRHMRIHTGEKPFRCEICGRSFSVKSSQKSHMVVHLKAKLS